MRSLCLLFCLGMVSVWGAVPVFAATMYPGFTTLGVWLPAEGMRFDVNVWYPSIRRPAMTTYGHWQVYVARNGRNVVGRFPLILLSHDSSGLRFSHHETAANLARLGFVVAAPTHAQDNMDSMSELFSLQQLVHRTKEMRTLLNVLLEDNELKERIDPNRIGVMGFGVGGTTALLLGGAVLHPGGWEQYCPQAGSQDVYCSPWASRRMERMVAALPLASSLADKRIKAVCAVDPAYGMLFSAESMQALHLPVLLIKSARDSKNRSPWHVDAIRKYLPQVPYFVPIEGIDSTALMSACPRILQTQVPDLCGSIGAAQRDAALQILAEHVRRFFLQTLGEITPETSVSSQNTAEQVPAPVLQQQPAPKLAAPQKGQSAQKGQGENAQNTSATSSAKKQTSKKKKAQR